MKGSLVIMKIQDYTKEMVDEKSFIDMAYTLLHDKGSTMNLYDIIDEFKSLGNYEYDEIENRIVQFYTDLNTDGRFLNVGENQWGLRDWYSVADIEEKIAPTIQKFDILDDDDEEDKTLKLLGEDEADDDERRQDCGGERAAERQSALRNRLVEQVAYRRS